MTATEFEIEVTEDPAKHIDFDVNATSKVLVNYSVRFFGYALRNMSTSAEARLDLYDGADTTGPSVFPINLGGDETTRDWFGPNGILFKNGVTINVTVGEVKGAIFTRKRPHT